MRSGSSPLSRSLNKPHHHPSGGGGGGRKGRIPPHQAHNSAKGKRPRSVSPERRAVSVCGNMHAALSAFIRPCTRPTFPRTEGGPPEGRAIPLAVSFPSPIPHATDMGMKYHTIISLYTHAHAHTQKRPHLEARQSSFTGAISKLSSSTSSSLGGQSSLDQSRHHHHHHPHHPHQPYASEESSSSFPSLYAVVSSLACTRTTTGEGARPSSTISPRSSPLKCSLSDDTAMDMDSDGEDGGGTRHRGWLPPPLASPTESSTPLLTPSPLPSPDPFGPAMSAARMYDRRLDLHPTRNVPGDDSHPQKHPDPRVWNAGRGGDGLDWEDSVSAMECEVGRGGGPSMPIRTMSAPSHDGARRTAAPHELGIVGMQAGGSESLDSFFTSCHPQTRVSRSFSDQCIATSASSSANTTPHASPDTGFRSLTTDSAAAPHLTDSQADGSSSCPSAIQRQDYSISVQPDTGTEDGHVDDMGQHQEHQQLSTRHRQQTKKISMGFKRGCAKCEQGATGHYAHFC